MAQTPETMITAAWRFCQSDISRDLMASVFFFGFPVHGCGVWSMEWRVWQIPPSNGAGIEMVQCFGESDLCVWTSRGKKIGGPVKDCHEQGALIRQGIKAANAKAIIIKAQTAFRLPYPQAVGCQEP